MRSEIYDAAKAYLTYFKAVFLPASDIADVIKASIGRLDRTINQLSEIELTDDRLKRDFIDNQIIEQFREVQRVAVGVPALRVQCQEFLDEARKIKCSKKASAYYKIEDTNSQLGQLPVPALDNVLSYLDPESFMRMRQVCKGFAQYINYNDFIIKLGDAPLDYRQEPMQIIKFHINASIFVLAALPHNLLAVGCEDGVIRICNTETGVVQDELRGHSDSVYVLAVFNDLLFSGSKDGVINIWDWGKKSLNHALTYHKDSVIGLTMLPCGWLISEDKRKVCFWDCRKAFQDNTSWPPKPWPVLSRNKVGIGNVVRMGNKIAFPNPKNQIEIWSCDSNEWQQLSHKLNCNSVGQVASKIRDSFIPGYQCKDDILSLTTLGDDYIVAGFQNSIICIWHWKTGRLLKELGDSIEGYFGGIRILVELSSNIFLTVDINGWLRIWNADTEECDLQSRKGEGIMMGGIIVTLDNRLVIGRRNGVVTVWQFHQLHELEGGLTTNQSIKCKRKLLFAAT